jgi:cytochrome c2
MLLHTHVCRDSLIILALGVQSLAVPLSAVGQRRSSLAGDPMAGERLFTERGCVRCHAIWGNGGKLGPDLGQEGLGRSLLQLAGMFWNHTPRMIETVRSRGLPWPTFTESDLEDVISYIYYVKLFDEPGDAALGGRWFREKRCVDCHAVGGTGGRAGPALDGFARYVAPIPLAQGMWNHGRAMRAVQATADVPMPRFYGSEISDIQAYLRVTSRERGRKLVLLAPPDPARGESLFRQKGCPACHGTNGRGTEWGPDLHAAVQHLGVSEIAGELWNHSAGMAEAIRTRGMAFPEFAGSDLADVIAYLYYLRFEETGGNRQVGKDLFTSKGCIRCHGAEADPPIGPDLSRSPVAATSLGLTTAMWNHAPGMFERAQQAGIPWPLFQGDEMRDLAAYLQSLSSK